MSKPGYYNMGIGALIGLAGAFITAATYTVAPGGQFVVAYGAILVGAIQFLIGLGQFLKFITQTREDQERDSAGIELRALVRSMVATASADGQISEKEITMIGSICKNLLGRELDESLIREIAKSMLGSDYSLAEDLKSTQSQISNEMKLVILKSCYLVMLSDGEMKDAEQARVAEMAETLKISYEGVVTAIREVNSSMQAA